MYYSFVTTHPSAGVGWGIDMKLCGVFTFTLSFAISAAFLVDIPLLRSQNFCEITAFVKLSENLGTLQ